MKSFQIAILRPAAIMAAAWLAVAPASADSTDFRALLQKHFDVDTVCVAFRSMPWETDNDWYIGNLRTLVAHGLIAETAGETPQRRRFDFTDKGRRFVRTIPVGRTSKMTGLCFARREITAIVKADIDPLLDDDTPSLDTRKARITFRHRLVDIADWAKDPAVQKAYDAIKIQLATGEPDTQKEEFEFVDGAWRMREPIAFPLRDARQLPK